MTKKTLAERRSAPTKRLAERSLTVCLAPDLIAEVQQLTDELADLPQVGGEDEDGNRTAAPRKMAERAEHPRAAEIRARLAVLLDEMAAEEGELRVRAVQDGEWRRWCAAHPARTEGEQGHERDTEVAAGYCNADDLIDDLAPYAASFDGEPLDEGDWDKIFADNISMPDKKQIASTVVAMHESRLDFRPWRNALSANLLKLNDSVSRATSPSAPDDSTAGSPEPSSEATTETVSESL